MRFFGFGGGDQSPYWKQVRVNRRRVAAAFLVGIGQFGVTWLVYDNPAADKWFALSVSLAGAAFFYGAFTLVAESEFRNLVRHQMRSDLAEATTDIVRKLRSQQTPLDIYPGSQDWDLRLNADITADLAGCTTYWFRGPTARFVPVRLQHLHRHAGRVGVVVRVVIMDPLSETTISRGADDRSAKTSAFGRSKEKLMEDIRRDICSSVAALWEVRGACERIELVYEASAVDVRVELFDQCVYVAHPRAVDEHPRYVRWDSRDAAYHEELVNFDWLWNHGSNPIVFDQSTTREQLSAHLRELGVPDPASRVEKLIAHNRNGAARGLEKALMDHGIWTAIPKDGYADA